MKNLGFFGLLLSLLLLLATFYFVSGYQNRRRIFSSYTLLNSSWEKYKSRFINQDGRVIDYSQNYVTTSEGQSYALLQAVWMDDRTTFDQVWLWTKNNLKRPNDRLFGWRWGSIDNVNYGLLPNGGANTASDADVDIALALILASRRWQDPKYLQESTDILQDIWEIDIAFYQDRPYLSAGNWAVGNNQIIVNPSYLAPYAYRLFSQVDPDHNWGQLVDTSYWLLTQSTQNQLDKSKSIGLPPDWVSLSALDGSLSAPNLEGLTTNYNYDAMRVPWRIALDYYWTQDIRAKEYLKSLSYFSTFYASRQQLPGSISHSGEVINPNENPVMYATSLGYFWIIDPASAASIYQDKILKLYSNDTNSFRDDLPYYESNWLWFGSALYLGYLTQFSNG
jgi:endo-1,4-beta-D-glucanase Y